MTDKFAFSPPDSRSYNEWKEVADREGHVVKNSRFKGGGKPNPFAAARNYSLPDKETVIHSYGSRNVATTFKGGIKTKREYRD